MKKIIPLTFVFFLISNGINEFDVASINEIKLIKKINAKQSTRSDDKSGSKVSNIIESRVSVRALDIKTSTQG